MRRAVCALLAALTLLGATAIPAAAHHSPATSTRRCLSEHAIDIDLITCLHQSHGHDRWRRGQGDEDHTIQVYRRQLNLLRSFLRAIRPIAARYAAAANGANGGGGGGRGAGGPIPHEANWDRVAACESSGNWSINTGNGYYGGLQFSLGTWAAYGGHGRPDLSSKRDQILVAERVRTQSGLHHWPTCGRRWYG